METEERNRAALTSVAVALSLILIFALFGQAILLYLNVSLESLMVAGSFLLAMVALELMKGTFAPSGDEAEVETGSQNIAFAPMGTPLLAGPGAIVTTMVFMQSNPSLAGQVSVISGISLAVVTMLPIFWASETIDDLLGRDVINALSRVMGILLAAIAVEFAHDAITRWF